ncbi:hypothetical protein BTN49_1752 [Candidatus Enterovibrio escicola]|uniref:Uncharacterized protein n=1 Tax=Candidatus Enterovibrio escicola TaxID=1927127 RepID=A0A2A5T312_9GAMM|nr:hypothetical protein BTN49_1752 [Candidatus Enterovibrio escacola]
MTVYTVKVIWDMAFYFLIESGVSTAKCSSNLVKGITFSPSLINIKSVIVI